MGKNRGWKRQGREKTGVEKDWDGKRLRRGDWNGKGQGWGRTRVWKDGLREGQGKEGQGWGGVGKDRDCGTGVGKHKGWGRTGVEKDWGSERQGERKTKNSFKLLIKLIKIFSTCHLPDPWRHLGRRMAN